MNDYDRYSVLLVRAVKHIFKKFLDDNNLEEIYETQTSKSDPSAAVEIDGSLSGELIITFPIDTLASITAQFTGSSDHKVIGESLGDVAGEMANLITGTFANQMQYADQDILLSPPEFNEDPIEVKTLYENINLSFDSDFGGFDIDLYYKEEEI